MINKLAKLVAAESSETLNYVVPDGQKIVFVSFIGSAAYKDSIKVEIIWNEEGTPELLFCTHGDITCPGDETEYVGDGVKTIKIKLTNASLQSETIMGRWEGNLYNV